MLVGRARHHRRGGAVLFYTSVNEPDVGLGMVREARPRDDDWLEWDKGRVVVGPPAGHDLAVSRDPTVVRDGSRWRMLVGAEYADGRAAVLTWTSDDLREWAFDGVAAGRGGDERDPVWTGSAWECRQLVSVGDDHVLVVSVWDSDTTCHVAAAVGDWSGGRFTPRRWTRLTYGTGHYAATAFTDLDGRSGLVFWIRDVGDPDAGWAGALSVPYLVSVDDGEARLTPHPCLDGARADDVLRHDWTRGVPGGVDGRLSLAPAGGHPGRHARRGAAEA